MLARRPSRGTTLSRWLAAYLLVLQAVIGGLATGAMAAPAAHDGFTLCLSAASADASTADHGGTPNSPVFHDCTACPLAGGVPLLPVLPTAQPMPSFGRAAMPPAPPAGTLAPIPLSESARPRAPPRLG